MVAVTALSCPTHTLSDSLVAANILNRYHRPGRYPGVANFASAVGQVISDSIRYSTHSLSHVSAHQDQPWNELDDSLAKAAASANFRPPRNDAHLVSRVSVSPWMAWMLTRNPAKMLTHIHHVLIWSSTLPA